MCGIFACIGEPEVQHVLLNGLRTLEYRGYDSAGMALVLGPERAENGASSLWVRRSVGKVSNLQSVVEGEVVSSSVGLSHTRWATHGSPTKENAHPHLSEDGTFAVVHNGIIENFHELKDVVVGLGYPLRSETDTELLAHLLQHAYTNGNGEDDLEAALSSVLKQVTGTYGLAVVSSREPTKILGARKGSPLVLGLKKGASFLASDASALVAHTRQVIYLDDGEVVRLGAGTYHISSPSNRAISKKVDTIEYDMVSVQKKGFEHFMLKEIFEQPESIKNTFLGRVFSKTGEVKLGGLNMGLKELVAIRRVLILACGTSWHAAMSGEYLIENWANLPVEVGVASEFAHRNCIIEPGTFVLVISQSGETADTLAALRDVKAKGIPVYGVVNVVGSSIARETDGGLYIHAGPEIGVASTKAFTAQLVALVLLAVQLGRTNTLSRSDAIDVLEKIEQLPEFIQKTLDASPAIKDIATQYLSHPHALYLGRGYNFPIALEGALKLKEIAYIHAEGYAAAEMKHGPIALIDKGMPVVAIATQGKLYGKMLTNIQEVRARGASVIALASEGDEQIKNAADAVLYVPPIMEALSPILNVIPLQLMAYYAAVERGCNVDQPRNLAKSVTVE